MLTILVSNKHSLSYTWIVQNVMPLFHGGSLKHTQNMIGTQNMFMYHYKEEKLTILPNWNKPKYKTQRRNWVETTSKWATRERERERD